MARLRGKIAPELVYYALGELEAKGYAIAVGPGAMDAASDAWWSGRGVTAPSLPTRLVDAGAHRPALAALRAALVGRSTKRKAMPGLVVIATGDYLDERLATEIRAALPRASHVLPVRLGGASIWIGPLLDRKTAGLFKVLLRRLKANRPADVAARALGARFPLLPVQGVPVTFDLAASWIASAASAIAAGAPPPCAQGRRDHARSLDTRNCTASDLDHRRRDKTRGPGADRAGLGTQALHRRRRTSDLPAAGHPGAPGKVRRPDRRHRARHREIAGAGRHACLCLHAAVRGRQDRRARQPGARPAGGRRRQGCHRPAGARELPRRGGRAL